MGPADEAFGVRLEGGGLDRLTPSQQVGGLAQMNHDGGIEG